MNRITKQPSIDLKVKVTSRESPYFGREGEVSSYTAFGFCDEFIRRDPMCFVYVLLHSTEKLSSFSRQFSINELGFDLAYFDDGSEIEEDISEGMEFGTEAPLVETAPVFGETDQPFDVQVIVTGGSFNGLVGAVRSYDREMLVEREDGSYPDEKLCLWVYLPQAPSIGASMMQQLSARRLDLVIADDALKPVKPAPEDDPVRPAHYGGDAVWKVIEGFQLGFNLGNVVKYVLRYKMKSGIEDLRKAQAYLERAISNMEQGHEP